MLPEMMQESSSRVPLADCSTGSSAGLAPLRILQVLRPTVGISLKFLILWSSVRLC